MPTQNSRVRGDGEEPRDPREDLKDAREDMEKDERGDHGPPPLAEGDFLPPDENLQEIAGHQVRKVSHEQLMRMHEEDAGGAPIFENFVAPSDQAMAQAQRRSAEVGTMQEEVDEMTPQWMRDRQPAPPPQAEAVPAPRETTRDGMPRLDMQGADEAVSVLTSLNRRATEAQAEGDLMGAKALRDAIQSIANAAEMKRRYTPKMDHPVLRKLKSSLGIEKIKPVRKEWAGLAWNCYPANVILDAWFLDNVWEDQRNFSALKLSTYCVGIDDVPLHEVFSIPLVHEYEVTVPEGDNLIKQKLTLEPYRKLCKTCGIEVKIDPKLVKCPNCAAIIDPFEVPMPLRLRCAERLYSFLQEEFGPTERLDRLVSELRDVIADRFADMDELYPLAKLSDEASTTDASASGEEQ